MPRIRANTRSRSKIPVASIAHCHIQVLFVFTHLKTSQSWFFSNNCFTVYWIKPKHCLLTVKRPLLNQMYGTHVTNRGVEKTGKEKWFGREDRLNKRGKRTAAYLSLPIPVSTMISAIDYWAHRPMECGIICRRAPHGKWWMNRSEKEKRLLVLWSGYRLVLAMTSEVRTPGTPLVV